MALRRRAITNFKNAIEYDRVSIASASALDPKRAVCLLLTGTTAVNHIRKPRSGKNKILFIQWAAAATADLNHNAGSVPTGYAPMLLTGAANVTAPDANDIIMLMFNGTAWCQMAAFQALA